MVDIGIRRRYGDEMISFDIAYHTVRLAAIDPTLAWLYLDIYQNPFPWYEVR